MAGTNRQHQVLEGVIDVMTELVKQNSYDNSPVVNPPTPSLNDFSQTTKNRLSFTEDEMSELEDVLTKLDWEREVIETQKKDSNKKNTSQSEEFNRGNNKREKLKAELKDELKSELKDELKFKSKRGSTFKETLIEHSSKYDPVELIIESGDKIKGILSQVKEDFVVLIEKNNDLIKIPISKILSLKKIKEINDNKPGIPQDEKTVEKQRVTQTEIKGAQLPAPEKLLARELIPIKKAEQKS